MNIALVKFVNSSLLTCCWRDNLSSNSCSLDNLCKSKVDKTGDLNKKMLTLGTTNTTSNQNVIANIQQLKTRIQNDIEEQNILCNR